jgi:hypothetical protein
MSRSDGPSAPRARARALLVVASLLAALPASAQQRGQPPLDGCSYDECGLRVESRGFFGSPTLLRGTAGRRVARFGVTGPDLATIVAGADSAVAHAGLFRPMQRRAGIAGLVSSIAGAGAIVSAASDEGPTATVFSVVSGVFGAYAGFEARRASRELSRAVWWYNKVIPR